MPIHARTAVPAALLALGLAAPMSHAQTPYAPKAVTATDYARAESMLAHKLDPLVDGAAKTISWQDGERVLWMESRHGQSRLMGFDAAKGTPLDLGDSAALAKSLAAASGGDVDAATFIGKLKDIRLDDAGLHFSYADSGYACPRDGACEKRAAAKDRKGDGPAVTSPDGRRAVFIRDWNLWLRDVASRAETQLTTDGSPDYGYATDNAGWQHSDKAIVLWSPDSSKLATFRQDQRRTSTMTLVATNRGAPVAQQWKYPFVGDEHVTMIERVVIDLSTTVPKVVRLKMTPDQHRSTSCDDVSCNGGWEDVQWAKDGRTLAFVSTDRGHKSAQLRVADTATGAVRDVYLETAKTQFESGIGGVVNWRYLPESNEFLWWTQKSGWGHLYLHDLATGKQKRAVTSGDWNVAEVLRLDAASRTVWFRGVGREPGRDPYFAHFYKASLDGGDVQLLTPENADHKLQLSDDGRFFIDTYSTAGTAPVTLLRRMDDGREVKELARADLTRLATAGWHAPEQFTVKGRDGRTDVYGMMWKPSHFDAKKKYPIVNYIYPGPQTGSIRTRSFATAQLDHQALAELGFIVVAMDGMGTPWRSKAFQDAYYGDMIDNTLPDQVAGMKQLAAKHPWIDLDRVGIWGHSGGGNATATAMFMYPHFFKVGISESGNHDNLSYEDDWAERYHGLMAKNADGTTNYTGQDNASHAKGLKGKLFLIHGMMDDNVPPQNTLLVVDALMKANKDFDLLMLPHARHGFAKDGWYVMRRRWDYFVQHLLGATPPPQYEIKPPAP